LRKKRLGSILISAALIVILAVFLINLKEGSSRAPADAVALSEIMISNKGSVPDNLGGYPDYIELHNGSTEKADISGYGLSDSLLEGAKYVFPAGTVLEPGAYVVVWCGGEAEDGMHAPFKLSAGEEVVLFDASGRPLDTAVLNSVDSGMVLRREGEVWTQAKPCPGYPKTEAGMAEYEASLKETEDIGLYINEFMASNATTLCDSFGSYSDWIELYNSTDTDMDISGFGISDNLSQPMKYRLPDGTTIAAKGYLVVFCSGNEGMQNGELHAPFGLRSYGEDVVIANRAGRIIDSYSFKNQETDVSMARIPDGAGEFQSNSQPSPGYPNTGAGYSAFDAANRLPLGGVYISEFGGSTGSVATDWVELHNSTGSAVSLAGYGLSNNPKNPAKWVFPDISIEPGEYLLLYATGSADKAQKKNLKLNFNISSTGEALFFFDPNGKLIDKLSAGRMRSGQSYGRDGSDNRFYYAEPTPGAQNGKGYEGITQLPAFSVTPGIYDNAVTVAITAGEGETIRYTTDCTTPNASSEVYSGELSISKNSVIRAAAFRDGYLSGDVATATYLFRSDGVNHALPVVTLVTDPDNLWNSKTGIYATGDRFDPDAASYADTLKSATYYQAKFATEEQVDTIWEKPAAFSLFDDNGQQVFTQNVGIRIAGSFGRGRAQKGFNVIARKEYGKGSMEYPFFENRPYKEYKAVVLRAGAQDQNRSKIRDELASGLLEGTDINILYQAYRPTVLYLNGEYWGVYFMKEKRNRFFVAQHENTENNVDLAIGKGFKQRSYGDNSDWVSLYEYATSHDLSSAEAYAYVSERMDVDSFRDYMIAEIYNGNTDTYNFQYYRLKGGKWKFIFYDFCWGFQSPGHETLDFRMGKTPSDVCSAKLFAAMLQNKGWRDSFCRRFGELLNTAFAPERVTALIDELYGYVEPEIKREREKFNKDTFMGVKQPNTNLGTYEGFQSEISKLKDFAQRRPEELKRQLQSNLGLSDSYMKEVFG
jgi:hypothetical protein